MLSGRGTLVIAIGAVLTVAACAGDPSLMNVTQTGDGPDEFAILPPRPLELPQNLAELPTPTPGGANRTDPTPTADAVAALGGNPAAVTRGGGVPSGDGALVGYAARNGVSPDIRQVLAAEDAQFRMENQGKLLERWANVNVYFRAYEPLALDQYSELERWRAAGVRNVAAPPLMPE